MGLYRNSHIKPLQVNTYFGSDNFSRKRNCVIGIVNKPSKHFESSLNFITCIYLRSHSNRGMRFHKELCPFVGSRDFCSIIRINLKILIELDNFVVHVFSCTSFIFFFFTSNFTPLYILSDAFP